MKRSRYLTGGLFTGICLGWALGYLRLPPIPQSQGFWVGLLSGMALFALWGLIRTARLRRAETGPLRVATFLVVGGLLAALLIWGQARALQAENQQQAQLMRQDSLLQHQAQQHLQAQLMVDFLAEVRARLAETQGQRLPEAVLDRLVRISAAFAPYPSADTLTAPSLSPERGLLLRTLLSMEMDSAVFSHIKKRVTFAHADLREMDLAGLDFSGADLRSASFQDARLTGWVCRACDLRRADFTAAQAAGADLRGADLRRVVFHGTEARGAILRETYLDGADLSQAVLEAADLSKSVFQWGQMGGANLAGATARDVDFMKTGMRQVNFAGADLRGACLRRTDLQQANFQGATLDQVSVNEADWVRLLGDWAISGAADVAARYRVVPDTVVRYLNSQYILAGRGE